MNDPYLVQPFRHPLSGQVCLPGSKSITNRALILSAISDHRVTLEGALFSDDTWVMIEALRQLGFAVDHDVPARRIQITGQRGHIPKAEASLFVGNAGTAARFLTALLCLHPAGDYVLDGSHAMRQRPMQGLLTALEKQGACRVTYLGEPGHFPFRLGTRGLRGGTLEIDASASSQILSALLLVAPLAQEKPLVLKPIGGTVSYPFIEMTLRMMQQFGRAETLRRGATGPFQFERGSYPAPGQVYRPSPTEGVGLKSGGDPMIPGLEEERSGIFKCDAYSIEPDVTAASYFMALPWVVGGQSFLADCGAIQLQGDIRFIDILKQLGGCFSQAGPDLQVHYPKRLTQGFSQNFNAISDTFLTLAALSPLLSSPLTLSGIAHTRKQETDRVAAMAAELRKLGQTVLETEDSLTSQPDLEAMMARTRKAPIEIDTYDDHRLAMSLAILGCYDLHGEGRPWLAIRNPACCRKTFPDFFETLQGLE